MAKQKTNSLLISLIIPAYKQESTIEKDLHRILEVAQQLRYEYEIIVVADGFQDKTFQNAKRVKSTKVKVVGYRENHGKGFAVRYGMAKARGSIIGFLDSGMDINPNGLSMLLEHFEWYNADIIVGSKLHPASKVQYPWQRRIMSFVYRIMVKILFGLTIRDTQVGMKFYRRKVLEDVMPRLLVKKHAFDIEILAVANYLGYTRIFEAPVEIDFNGVSTITSKNFWIVVGLMVWDTLAVFYRLRILHYYDGKNRKNWYNALALQSA